MAIGVHEGFQPAVPPLGWDRRPSNFLVMHAVSHTFEQMFACAQLIAEGVLERHPGLRVVFLEAGGGWVPYWLARLDHQVDSYAGYAPRMRLTPSEYFARQCWVSFEIDEVTLPALVPFVGADRIVWGSDYPHADSTFPGALDELRATVAPLPEAQQQLILSANAAALYRLGSDPQDLCLLRRELLVGEDALGVEIGELLQLRHVVVGRGCGGRRLDVLRLLGLILRRVLLLLTVLDAAPHCTGGPGDDGGAAHGPDETRSSSQRHVCSLWFGGRVRRSDSGVSPRPRSRPGLLR